MSKLEAADRARQNANFTLEDLQGNSWTLKDFRGKLMSVNLWATRRLAGVCKPATLRTEQPLQEMLGSAGIH
jgi:hypothetical protein